jgi:ESX secretion-associated protein EspG
MQVLRVPVDVLVTALRWEGVEQPHTVLATTARWLDDDTRRELDREVRAELPSLGLSAEAVSLIARPSVEYYATGTKAVLAVSDGRNALVVTRDSDTAWLRPARPDALADAVVTELPTVPAAQGRSLNVSTAELTGPNALSDEGFSGFAAEPSIDVRMLKALMAEPRTNTGQLHVAVRDALGRRRRSKHTVTYLDLTEGRWMTGMSTGWVYAAPATPRALVTKLAETHRALG